MTKLYYNKENGRLLVKDGDSFSDGQYLYHYGSPYGELKVSLVESKLSTVGVRCDITPHVKEESFILGERRTIWLPKGTDPLSQVLAYYNKRSLCEYRATAREDMWGKDAVMVALSATCPREIQWLYRGDDKGWSAAWTEEEMLPIEDFMHTYMKSWANNYWELRKVPEDHRSSYTAYYIAKRFTWEYGSIGGKTPMELAQALLNSELKH